MDTVFWFINLIKVSFLASNVANVPVAVIKNKLSFLISNFSNLCREQLIAKDNDENVFKTVSLQSPLNAYEVS